MELRDLLPFEKHTYISSMPPWELIDHLSDWIAPSSVFSFKLFGKSHKKPYEGEVNGNQFRINRVIGYRNSFLPKISGRIEVSDNGSIVHILMRPNVLVLAFMTMWLGIAGYLFLGGLVIFLSSEHQTLSIVLVPGGMFLFGYSLLLGAFKYESIQSRKDLEKALKAFRLGTRVPV